MESYLLRVKFYSPMVYYHVPTLDAVISWCLARAHADEGAKAFCHLPLATPEKNYGLNLLNRVIEHKGGGFGVPVASMLQPDHPPHEFEDAWKKRFESKHARLADFGKARRRINTSSGLYRSYNVPMPAKSLASGWFVFRGDGYVVRDLLETWLIGIGKKVTEGFGWIEEWRLEESALTWREILALRPVPVRLAPHLGIETTGRRQELHAWKPPYWLRRNCELCLMPDEQP